MIYKDKKNYKKTQFIKVAIYIPLLVCYDSVMDKTAASVERLLTNQAYTREELYDLIFRVSPAYSPNSCNWVIGQLVENGVIACLGNGVFQRSKGKWSYEVSNSVKTIIKGLKGEFPFTELAVIPSAVLDNLFGQDHEDPFTLIEVSKRDLFSVFMWLREHSKKEIMLDPTERELNYYLKANAVVLKPIFSKSPCGEDGKFTLEKLLVDAACDRTLKTLYYGGEYPEQLLNEAKQNNVNLITALNYAKRRRCESKMLTVLHSAVSVETWEKVVEVSK